MKRYLVILIAGLLLTAGCSKKTDDASTQAAPATTATTPAATPREHEAAARKPEPPPPVVIPAGTVITVQTQSALGSKTSHSGDAFDATVAQPVSVDGKEVIASGAGARGTVVEAQAQGKIKGQGSLQLTLTSITIKGVPYTIQTSNYDATVKGKGKRTAIATGGGGALGALIGGLAGGGKGAAIGAAAGAGAGLAGGAFTGNKQIELPAESALSFTLSAPITVK
jgi:hypothetical protein